MVINLPAAAASDVRNEVVTTRAARILEENMVINNINECRITNDQETDVL